MGSVTGDPDACGPIRQRVLLIYANGEREPWPVMPIGLSFVAAALQARGHDVWILDLVFCDDWPEQQLSVHTGVSGSVSDGSLAGSPATWTSVPPTAPVINAATGRKTAKKGPSRLYVAAMLYTPV